MLDMNLYADLCRKFPASQVRAAMEKAEESGEADLHGYTIRFTRDVERRMIALHPSWGGIYVGDYPSYVHFQKDILYRFPIDGRKSASCYAKHRDTASVMERCMKASPTGEVLCECSAGMYNRRRKKVESLGYKVIRDNYAQCEREISSCVFVVTR